MTGLLEATDTQKVGKATATRFRCNTRTILGSRLGNPATVLS